MPMFSINAPKTTSDMSLARKKSKMVNYKKPIGQIGVSERYQYGFDGINYYVTEGILSEFVTRIHLTFDEAKQLFNALNWIEDCNFCFKKPSELIKKARKKKINNDDLFWFIVDNLN